MESSTTRATRPFGRRSAMAER